MALPTQPAESLVRAAIQQCAQTIRLRDAFGEVTEAIAPLNTDGTLVPIYWVHSVTGKGVDPINVAEALGPEQPFYSVQCPTNKRNGRFPSSVEAMASFYASEIHAKRADGPVNLAGWSAGIVVALETAQILRAAGRDVAHLIAVDYAPRNTIDAPIGLVATVRKAGRFVRNQIADHPAFGVFIRRLASKAPALRHLGVFRRGRHPIDFLVDELRLTGAPADFIRTFYDAAEAYRPQRYEGPVLLYLAKDAHTRPVKTDWKMNGELMVRRWRMIAPRLHVSYVVGDHSSIVKPPDSANLAQALRQDLAGFDPTLEGGEGGDRIGADVLHSDEGGEPSQARVTQAHARGVVAGGLARLSTGRRRRPR